MIPCVYSKMKENRITIRLTFKGSVNGVNLNPIYRFLWQKATFLSFQIVTHQTRLLMILDSLAIEHDIVDITAPAMDEARNFMRENGKKKDGERHVLPPQIFNGDKYCGVSKNVYLLVRHLPFIAKGAGCRILTAVYKMFKTSEPCTKVLLAETLYIARRNQQIYFFRLNTLCTHLSGSNLWKLNYFCNSFSFHPFAGSAKFLVQSTKWHLKVIRSNITN